VSLVGSLSTFLSVIPLFASTPSPVFTGSSATGFVVSLGFGVSLATIVSAPASSITVNGCYPSLLDKFR